MKLKLYFFFIVLFVSAASFAQSVNAIFFYSGGCSSPNIQFYDYSSASSGTLTTWQWNFGDPASGSDNTSNLVNPSHIFSGQGTFNVMLHVMDNMGNSDDTTIAVTVSTAPILAWSSLSPVCINAGPVSIASAIVTNGVPGSGSYSGIGVSPAGMFDPSVAGVGTHNVYYLFSSTGGCYDTAFQSITVNPKPNANFMMNNPQTCVGSTTMSYNTSTGASGMTYVWHFGDGSSSTASNPLHMYPQAGTYMIKLIAIGTGGCSDSIAQILTVTATPTAGFTQMFWDSVCFRNMVYFNSTSTNATHQVFYFGDGTSDSSASTWHTYATPGTYAVKHIASNYCGADSATQVLVIAPQSNAIMPAMPRTLTANRQCDADNGWTNYYFDNNTPGNTTDDTLLLALKLNGQYIGKIGDGIFQLSVSATAGAGSNTGILLNSPLITNPTGYWVMNRYWNVTPAFQPTTPVGVRFYFNTQDLNDVNGSYPTHNLNYTDLIFYKTTGGNPDPTTNLAGSTAITSLMHGAAPDTTHWVYSMLTANSHVAEFQVSHFSGGGGGATGNLQALPLKLLSFDAYRSGKTVKLQWTTAGETNVKEFEVQRSANGREYSAIGTVPAGSASYTYNDNSPQAVNHYRLKMIDRNGSFTYSPVRMVSNSSNLTIAVYPNPAKNFINIAGSEISEVILADNTGRVVLTKKQSLSSTARLDVSAVHSGVYLIKVTDSKGVVSSKVIIE